MTLPEARAALAAHDLAYAAVQAHNQALRIHAAQRPTPPKGERPAKPSTACPTAADLDAAQRVQADATRAEGAAKVRAAQLEQAQADLAAAEKRLTAATVEAARNVKLVAATRRAPGEDAAAQLAALGDMEGVVVAFAGEERGARDPYVTVSYQGIPFSDLSGGQKVLADALLRRGWRAAAGLRALSIVVDDCVSLNAGAGPWPDLGASIMLVTT